MKPVITCLMLIFSLPLPAQSVRWGAELDALPFLSGGYYGSVIAGYDQWQVRAVLTRTTLPDFATSDLIKSHRLDAMALIGDYFFDSTATGWWVGSGVEWWSNRLEPESGGTRSFDQWVLTLGGGYTWEFTSWLYVNPWAALHLPVSGTSPVQVGSVRHEPQAVVVSGSVKVGLRF